MESQLQAPPAHRHTYEEDHPHNTDLHNVIEREDEYHEKKSVYKKVKDKAKKIKDTIGNKMHSHGHEGDHERDHEVEEDEDDEEEIEQDPEFHGAPKYDATKARIVPTQQEDMLGQSGADSGPTQAQLPPLEKDPLQAPKQDRFEPSDPGNHQTKATDPTGPGGKEARVTPLISSFGKMEISNEPGEQKPLSSTEESHDQTVGENSQAVPKSSTAREPDSHAQAASKVQEQSNQSSYTGKLSAATSTIAEKAISAKNAVASKLGYGGNDDAAKGGDATKSATVSSGSKVTATVTEKLAPVYEKVAEVGSAVVSKMKGTGTGTGTGTETEQGKEDVGGTKTNKGKGISMKEYVAEKLRPSHEDKALSEVISEAFHKRKGEEPQKVSQPEGKVIESPEVAKRLGSDDSDDKKPEGFSPGNEAGKGMVGMLKGAVTSWLGKNGEQHQQQQQKSQASHSSSAGEAGGDEVGQDIAGERKHNESTN